ncbi:hypothetical protein OV090_06790 [Nannocystis sp. RBIL2]|uniref:hypothetical protein n=1 Tax=Nannocystis sp. RBIL2 TaxID=2996788 RepID=UPI00226D8A15|nr:hypothetical protein [Nannocystis sp. RBIL2]MCY1064459.1 hypothetical protein [Nannocystis sp. RBIL2]
MAGGEHKDVEIDFMDPKGGDGQTVDPGMVPYKPVLDRIRAVFADHGFHLHFDVGDLLDASPGLDPAEHDCGGGNQVPFPTKVCYCKTPGFKNFDEIKAHNLAINRWAMFHYVVFANEGGKPTTGGEGERPGNDVYISHGKHLYKFDTPQNVNYTYNHQAYTLMHELGHNLGLSHGGYSTTNGDSLADEANYKPNYFSIMNYLYDEGLPVLGTQEGERYYYEHADVNPLCAAKGVKLANMSASSYGPLAQFRLDYSSGVGSQIDLAAEEGLGQPGSQWVDFDCDGLVDAATYADDLYAKVDGMNVPLTLLRDHDDWGGLDLYFVPSTSGFNNAETAARSGRPELMRVPILNDRQPLDRPDPLPEARRRRVRR